MKRISEWTSVSTARLACRGAVSLLRGAVAILLVFAGLFAQPVRAIAQEEAPVGGVALGLGYSSDENGSLRGRIWHDRFLGRSQQIDLGFYLTERQQSFDLQYTNDRFTSGTPSMGIGLRHTEVDMGPRFGFSTRRSSIVPHLDWPRSGARPPIRVSLGLSQDEFYDITASAPAVILAEPSERTAYALGVESLADMDWYRWNLRLAVVGDDKDMRLLRFNGDIAAATTVGASETELSARLSLGAIHVLEGATTFHDRFLPSTGDLRGFSYAGFGPVDPNGGSAGVGATSFATLQFDARRAGLLPNLPQLELGLFVDVGSAWGFDDGNQAIRALVNDDADLRASVSDVSAYGSK